MHPAKGYAAAEAAGQPELGGHNQAGAMEASVAGLLGNQQNIQPLPIPTPGNGVQK